MKRVYILLVNWNGWEDTLECLESLLCLEYCDFRIVLIDNDSSDGSPEYIKSWARGDLDLIRVGPPGREIRPSTKRNISFVEYDQSKVENSKQFDLEANLVLVRTRQNLGFAGGNNVGLRYVQACGDASYVWLLNNDTVADKSALSGLLDVAQSNPRVGMCGSTLLYYNSPETVQVLGGAYYCRWLAVAWHLGQRRPFAPPISSEKVERRMSYVVGASLLVSNSFLDQVGPMTEDYFLYFEEIDWVVRGEGRFQMAFAPESIIYHKVGSSIGTRSHPARKSLSCDYYSLRNRLLFTRRHFPWALPTVYLGLFAEVALRILFGRWSRAKMILALMVAGKELPPLSCFDDGVHENS